MPKVLRDLLNSKKALASSVGILSVLLVLLFGDMLGIDQETADKIAGAIIFQGAAYVTAQGRADTGKEAGTKNYYSENSNR